MNWSVASNVSCDKDVPPRLGGKVYRVVFVVYNVKRRCSNALVRRCERLTIMGFGRCRV